MSKQFAFIVGVICAVLWGCESQQQMVNDMKPKAVQTALQRGAFELNCPSATAQVLSDEMIETGATRRYAPPERGEYTVGVQGCGKRATYMVVCAEGGTGCSARGADNTIQKTP
jgi:hypothetical protein